ncbi:LysE family transporter [Psychroserpens luteolus]|uniref:LysE family transporter n=1 Tax=Psychroserpens luteolus TaxID=2855840 RepID=UPI001E3F7A18|nr:LysE family transporter [Psychroserpens luteolus]MCD2260330.1 LysE family translocator [Psychroserpens luteolus]
MIFIYFIIGVLASVIGALPLGASNIAVINTTIKQNAKQAFKIAIAAGIAEVILSYYALHCNMIVRDFFDQNMWIQIVIVVILMAVGSFLIFKKNKEKSSRKKRLTSSKYATGFLLGILNPPVLIYWIVAFGIINNNDLMLSLGSPLFVLFLFFAGVYLGKLLTLYLYSKFSIAIKNKVQNITLVINKVTGILLIVIGIAQAIKLSL